MSPWDLAQEGFSPTNCYRTYRGPAALGKEAERRGREVCQQEGMNYSLPERCCGSGRLMQFKLYYLVKSDVRSPMG